MLEAYWRCCTGFTDHLSVDKVAVPCVVTILYRHEKEGREGERAHGQQERHTVLLASVHGTAKLWEVGEHRLLGAFTCNLQTMHTQINIAVQKTLRHIRYCVRKKMIT